MEPQNNLKMQIEKDGKILQYVRTKQKEPHTSTGYLTDVYKDEDGNLHFIERLQNNIRFTNYNRLSGEGNITSFGTNLKLLIQGMIDGFSESEYDRHIRKCKSSLETARKYFTKENPENFNTVYAEAVQAKVVEIIDEMTLKQYSPETITVLDKLIDDARIKEEVPFSNALVTKVYVMKKAESENEPTL